MVVCYMLRLKAIIVDLEILEKRPLEVDAGGVSEPPQNISLDLSCSTFISPFHILFVRDLLLLSII